MDHNVMFLILVHLAECRLATSRDVAQKLSFISPKYASLVLTRCYRRGFVSRQPYKRRREHGYVYKLTNKGAEWILYKHSQRTKEDQRDRKPQKQVENEDIPVQNIMILKPDGTRQENEAFTFPKIALPILASDQYSKLHQLQDFLAGLALLRSFSRDDFADYFFLEQQRKSSGGNQKERTVTSSASLYGSCSAASETRQRFRSRSVELQYFGLGIKLGTTIGEISQLLRNQNALLTILKRKFGSRNLNDTHITTLQMASTKTPRFQKPTEVTSKLASTSQNIAVEEPRENEGSCSEMNDWWRHLPKQYIR